MDADERETIKAALSGDQESFEMIIHLYSRKVFAVAYAILQDRDEAEDTVQETFLKTYKSRWRLRDPEKISAWLGTVARNRARDILRRRRTVPLPDEHEEIADTNIEKPGQQMDDAEMHLRVHSALATLPEHHRTALTLRYLEGMDHHAIEQTMRLSNGALRGILGRALGTMRQSLKPALTSSQFPL